MSQSLSLVQSYAWDLATTLMVCVTLFKTGDGRFNAVPSGEFDGEPESIITEYDPFAE